MTVTGLTQAIAVMDFSTKFDFVDSQPNQGVNGTKVEKLFHSLQDAQSSLLPPPPDHQI